MKTEPLGVGLVYIPGLEPLFESPDVAVQVLELEPQVLWRYFPNRDQPYENQLEFLKRLQALPQAKTVHGVGFPVGGSRIPDPRHIPPLREAIQTLNAAWASEHLVFNESVDAQGNPVQTGFFLPPLAMPSGVDAACRTIQAVSAKIPVPFAVETPTNYLKPIPGEMSDGAFTAAVVETADCGILLDLHNIWSNERNGRQSVEAFLSEIPLDRVWEIHLAGGLKYGDYWLDAHSGDIPRPVIEWAQRLIPYLPNLGAVIYEILPAYLPRFGLDGVRRAVDEMHDLWSCRCSAQESDNPFKNTEPKTVSGDNRLTPEVWERKLSAQILFPSDYEDELSRQLANDPAVALIRELNRKFRLSAIISNLRMSIRLLMLSLDDDSFDRLVADYCVSQTPDRFAVNESHRFAEYIRKLDLEIPYLYEVLNYEITAMDVIADGQARTVPFTTDPQTLLEILGRGELPIELPTADYEAEITPPEERAFETQSLIH
ncbi:MAG: DUF692 domain-containing protein [Candidatus Thiodiazotropha lotti]|uniref:DUF692 domain-containing protein n=1 Tax=Candidatus Thiodiazotropha lotti TaxID=2792787 RepID=A0A9E4K4U3_9GAMM|nr:DUF692 domain-containing protein [Candidatus Thiodiazotropha lotti]MCG7928805.1 DUF692 domain-containing protein [Candidatus Thiodiazotropha lotti]MCG7939430.1 DUF692 domain-containing protein [Candidatus Thiodiazotropha lotti]MCW4203903.1 DUF692 domain-containing protein [Candidatus Thiodiazotropha lotti]MCW4218648.1 DUF692 domain-containing protein [Candidatus Thiodiazotropha lotti]